MPSKVTLSLSSALAGIALCCSTESGFGQDAVVAPIIESDADDGDDMDDKSYRPRARPKGNVTGGNSRFVINSGESLSLAATSVTETADVEGVVVTGTWFDSYPVPYPAPGTYLAAMITIEISLKWTSRSAGSATMPITTTANRMDSGRPTAIMILMGEAHV
jgi:hypothetical protein